jgi:hypothetical protein
MDRSDAEYPDSKIWPHNAPRRPHGEVSAPEFTYGATMAARNLSYPSPRQRFLVVPIPDPAAEPIVRLPPRLADYDFCRKSRDGRPLTDQP